MAKITNVRLPNGAAPEYNQEQTNQLIRSLEQVILALNTTYTPIVTEQTDQAMTWFEASGSLPGSQGGSLPLLPYGAWEDTATTTLAANITNAVTTITTPANGTTNFPTAGQILLEEEIVSYTGKTSASFTGCTRGAFGTANVAHTSGIAITKTQCLAANTDGVMYLNTTDSASDMALVSSSRMTVYQPGIYNFQWSGQFVNSDTQLHDASIWVRINGTDLAGSMGLISVPNSHGGINGHSIGAWNYALTLNANDYVELWWSTNDQRITMQCLPTQTSPTRPATASLITTMTFMSSIA